MLFVFVIILLLRAGVVMFGSALWGVFYYLPFEFDGSDRICCGLLIWGASWLMCLHCNFIIFCNNVCIYCGICMHTITFVCDMYDYDFCAVICVWMIGGWWACFGFVCWACVGRTNCGGFEILELLLWVF